MLPQRSWFASLGVAAFCLSIIRTPSSADPTTLWTTGKSLMPAWGLYPNGAEYGGTKSLDGYSAWKSGLLTWVADIPADGIYYVWARKYGGYGALTITVDEKPLGSGKGGGGGGKYVWLHCGMMDIPRGPHHIDIDVRGTMFDAAALTTDAAFDPSKDALPDPVVKPQVRVPRKYRDDTALKGLAGSAGFVVASLPPYSDSLNDDVPSPARMIEKLPLWGAANQYTSSAFVARALKSVGTLNVSLSELIGPQGKKVAASEIDLRVVHLRNRPLVFFGEPEGQRGLCPGLLLRDDRTDLPPKGKQGGYGGGTCVTSIAAHESRQFLLTAHVPEGHPAGTYKGKARFRGGSAGQQDLLVELEVLPIDLKAVEGYYSIYWPSQPLWTARENYVTPERYLAELQDRVRHGLNAATLYGGEATMKYAQEAGMTEDPCIMHWPDSAAPKQVEEAKAMGFPDLYYYGVDEPGTPEQIERCQKEAERRMQSGLHMFTAINSAKAQEATKDFIDRPVYNIYVFGGKDNAAVKYALDKGFKPISYWTTAVSYPLWYRALAGLYNTACGYLGAAPWAYQDFPDSRLYGEKGGHVHVVSFPDENGQPIPTLRWEEFREGVDDVRFLQALDRAMAAAEALLGKASPPAGLNEAVEKARAVRRERYESIGGRWFEYLCALGPETLAVTRRAMADAVVELNKCMEK